MDDGAPAAILGDAHAHARRSDTASRLRLARQWLDLTNASGEQGSRAALLDRNVFAWSAAAAVRGDRDAQVLLGRCFAAGRGIAVNLQQARRWFRRAAQAGSSEARYRLRELRIEPRGWLRHRYAIFFWLGVLLLVIHAFTAPLTLNAKGVIAYLALCAAALPIYFVLHTCARSSTIAPSPTSAPRQGDYIHDQMVATWMRRPWQVFRVATEDALCLVPLLWLGITPWTALGAGAIFGLAHYPTFSGRICVIKAIEYSLVAWWLAPWAGLWSIIIGHIVWDVTLLSLGAWSRRRSWSARTTPSAIEPGMPSTT